MSDLKSHLASRLMLTLKVLAVIALFVLAFHWLTGGQQEVIDGKYNNQSYSKKAPHVYGAVGDSITAGVGTNNASTKAYPVVAGVPAIGYPGRCSAKVCWSWDPMMGHLAEALSTLPENVDTIVFEMGVNDLNTGAAPIKVVRSLESIKAEGAKLGVRVVFSTIVPPGMANPWHDTDKVLREKVNNWIRLHGPYVEYAKPLANKSGILRKAYDSGDGLHPSNAGAAVMAGALVDFMKANR